MKFLNKLEYRFGRYAIRNLMLYIVLGTAAVYFMCMFNMELAYYLVLMPSAVWHGQVWRLVTFLFIPPSISARELLLVGISLYFYYFVGKMLEGNWGAFKFNVYYLIGVLCTIIMSLATGSFATNEFLNETLFLAFATLFPEVTVLLFMFIPIKVKWLGYASGVLLLYQFIRGTAGTRLMIAAGLVNYLLFFGPVIWRAVRNFFVYKQWKKITRLFTGNGGNNQGRTSTNYGNRPGYGGSQSDRTRWTNPYAGRGDQGKVVKGAFHRCRICGKTELDDPSMQFRYCAECDGALEYCMDHLYNHEHVRSGGNE